MTSVEPLPITQNRHQLHFVVAYTKEAFGVLLDEVALAVEYDIGGAALTIGREIIA